MKAIVWATVVMVAMAIVAEIAYVNGYHDGQTLGFSFGYTAGKMGR